MTKVSQGGATGISIRLARSMISTTQNLLSRSSAKTTAAAIRIRFGIIASKCARMPRAMRTNVRRIFSKLGLGEDGRRQFPKPKEKASLGSSSFCAFIMHA